MVRSLANRRLRYSPNLVNFGLLFREAKIFHGGYFCCSATKFGSIRDIGAWQVLRGFGKLWSGGPAIPWGDLHKSFTDALVFLRSPILIRGVTLEINERKEGVASTWSVRSPVRDRMVENHWTIRLIGDIVSRTPCKLLDARTVRTLCLIFYIYRLLVARYCFRHRCLCACIGTVYENADRYRPTSCASVTTLCRFTIA